MSFSVEEKKFFGCLFGLYPDLVIKIRQELCPGDQFHCQGCPRHCLVERMGDDTDSIVKYINGYTENLPNPSVLPRGTPKEDPGYVIPRNR